MRTIDAVQDYLRYSLEQGDTASTVARKSSILTRFAHSLPELPLDPPHIFKFLGTCGKTHATRKSARKTVRAFYTYICEKYDLPDPMPRVAIPLRAAKRAMVARQTQSVGGGVRLFSLQHHQPRHPLPPLWPPHLPHRRSPSS